ncbi:galactose oxidase [Gigaspora margarita]|uniref:Galactose oxidase n=1 Tax=Gigaspora margarita TaxID=4874 RepID=A0A8H3XG07_GIGMA|nr:galactose oxidase [Gigaspora margarita]
MIFIFIFAIYLFVTAVISKPEGRYAAASALIDNKLYFIGGQFQNGTISSELFYLDLSASFNVNTIASHRWSDPSPAPIASAWATATVGGDNKSRIFLIGGIMNPPTNDTVAYSFNTNIGNWSNITTSGGLNQKRKGSSLSYDPDSGYIYIFGGQSVSNSSKWFHEMIIFDSINFSWSNVTSSTAPSKRSGHTATLLKSGIIVFIGGWELNENSSIPRLTNMSQIWTYNTNSANWSFNNAKFTNDTIIGSRIYHSAVLASDGKIIIYGGSNGINNSKVLPDLAVLNVSSTQFQWSIPNIKSSNNTARSLVGHTAVIIDDYMILLFGNVTGRQPNVNDMIYLLNTKSYDWAASYQSNAPNNSTVLSLPAILCIIVGSIVLVFIIGFSIIWRYQKCSIKRTLLVGNNSQKVKTRSVLHDSDDDNSTRSEEQHHYFDLPSRNSSESQESHVTTFYDYQRQVFQQRQPIHYMMPIDGASYHQDQGNEGHVRVISYAQHDIEPQYVEYDTTSNHS